MRNILLFCIAIFQLQISWAEEPSPFPEPIDIVYLWVDGNDPDWRAIKNYYHALIYEEVDSVSDARTKNRFSDNEELRYSLRSVMKYAPFFNHIYIVTMNQRPKWLASHPKITIIDHTEIFKSLADLPTFNSQALESNLHRIPNLKEHFIYFNDDVFLGRPVTPYDFFTSNDEIKVLFEPSWSPSGPPIVGETTYRIAWRNTNALLNARYKEEPRKRLCHAPFALRKSYVEQSEREFPEVFASNSSHKFRSIDDYNITNGLLQYHWSYYGKMVVGEMSNRLANLRNDLFFEKTKSRLEHVKAVRPHTFCIEDNMGDDCERTKELLHQFLEELYPEPAPWEKNPS